MKRWMSLLLVCVVLGVTIGTSLAYAGEDLSGEDPPISAAGKTHNNAGLDRGPNPNANSNAAGGQSTAVNAGNKGNTPSGAGANK